MQTTLAIDDDILAEAGKLATLEQKTVGEVISDLARKALRPAKTEVTYRNGVPLLPITPNSRPITQEMARHFIEELS